MDQIIEIITNLFAQIAEWFQAFIQRDGFFYQSMQLLYFFLYLYIKSH